MPHPLSGCQIKAEIKGFLLMYRLFQYKHWFLPNFELKHFPDSPFTPCSTLILILILIFIFVFFILIQFRFAKKTKKFDKISLMLIKSTCRTRQNFVAFFKNLNFTDLHLSHLVISTHDTEIIL
jgi:hypothetical protein